MAFALRETLRLGMKSFVFPAFGSGMGGYGGSGYGRLVPGSDYDYRAEAGVLMENSIVFACVRWLMNAYAEVTPEVERKQGKKYVPEDSHPLADLIENPNPDYNGNTLICATIVSLLERGLSFWFCVRGNAGHIVQLYYIPHSQMMPVFPSDGSAYISGFRYTVNGQSVILAPEDVCVIRNGMDPNSTREGLSSLRPTLREICTDNEAASLAAALLRNTGIPGVIIRPDGSDKNGNFTTIGNDTAEKLRGMWKRKFSGEGRGEPFVFQNGGLKIETFAFSPQQLLMDKIRNIPEERITACVGVPAIAAGMGAGLAHGTFSNFDQATDAAYHNGLRPICRTIADGITHKFRDEPLYNLRARSQRFAYNYDSVPALQPDKDKEHVRLGSDFQDGGITRNEYRAGMGYESVADGDKFVEAYMPVKPKAPDGTAATGDPEAKPGK